jgi:hypothetical protein
VRLYYYGLKEDVIKKMNIKKNTLLTKNTKLGTITLILLLTLSAMITFAPEFNVDAQVYDTPTFLFLTASPNPVGVGQQVRVTQAISLKA